MLAFKNIKFRRSKYQPIFPRQKHYCFYCSPQNFLSHKGLCKIFESFLFKPNDIKDLGHHTLQYGESSILSLVKTICDAYMTRHHFVKIAIILFHNHQHMYYFNICSSLHTNLKSINV